MSDNRLPAAFGNLNSFVDKWGSADDMQRLAHREAASLDELRSFYDAMTGQIDRVMSYLQGFKEEDAPEEARLLYRVACSFMDVGFFLERVIRTDRENQFPMSRIKFLHSGF